MESLRPAQPSNTPVDPMDKLSPIPQNSVQNNPYDQVENIKVKGSGRNSLIILLSLFIILILLVGSTAFLALVAYGKVDIRNEQIQQKISFVIQELPYTPKTGTFLIYKSMEAQKNLKSIYLDSSIALTSSQADILPSMGNKFDLKISGPIDFIDQDKPEANINIKMTPELDIDFVSVNDKAYFKINDIPAVLKGLVSGAGYSLDTVLAKWIVYDLKSLDSDARDLLNEDKSVRDDDKYNRARTAIINSKVLNKIVVKETELDGNPVYEMSLELSSKEYSDFMNDVQNAMDDPGTTHADFFLAGPTSYPLFDTVKITADIDKSTMYTTRSTISFRLYTSDIAPLDVPSQVLGTSTIANFPSIYTQAATQDDAYMDVAIVIRGSRFNEDFKVDEPTGSIPIETIIAQFTEQAMNRYQFEDDAMEFDMDSEGFGSSTGNLNKVAPQKILPKSNPDDDSSGFAQ